jgi:hypothetical protein
VYDLSYRGLPVVRSLAEFVALANASYNRDAAKQMGHHATNIYVHPRRRRTMRADSKVISIFAEGDLKDGGTASCADFHDVVVKTAAGWRIKERVAVSRWPNPASFTRSETIEVLKDQVPG